MPKDITQRAHINLTLNAKQAQQVLSDQKKRVEDLDKQLKKLMDSNADPKAVKALKKELAEAKRLLNNMQTESAHTADVLSRLDKASPRELNKALRDLQNNLSKIQRGTEAWDQQVDKIRKVKQQIAELNKELYPKSNAERMMDYFNKWQAAILGVAGAMTGLILAGKKAVAEFAQMDEAMANTRKFCGLTEDGVRELNEEFKKMDTRTSREKLNELAQEAGRLGKQSKEDILEYVKAADILNVALSDLGEGATQKIAKLSNIFGVEDMYGTYDSMVKIGSVVNVLSQNCTASKPYLVEFTNRLAGVGNQANMTIPQIVGLGAVLDSNAQKVEASSTAIAQVLTRMYVDPSKYARVAGLDVENFANLLKTDANEALLQFLEALNKAGNMEALAPMFKDMGESGARAIASMSTLAKHIDEVRVQQINANEAFEEGTSVLNEYNIFNNTTQAILDKAKKAVSELAVQLGEKLLPVMRYFHSSSRVALDVLDKLVDFMSENWRVLVSLTAAVAAYTLAVNASNIAFKAHYAWLVVVEAAQKAWRATLILSNAAMALFTGNVTRARAAMQLFNAVVKANPVGLFVGALTAAASALVLFSVRTKDSKKDLEDWKKSLTDVSKEADDIAKKSISYLERLYKAAIDETLAKKERIKAAEQLLLQYPEVFKNMDIEDIMLRKAQKAYDDLTTSIKENAKAKAAANKMESLQGERLELDWGIDNIDAQIEQLIETRDKAVKDKEYWLKKDKEDGNWLTPYKRYANQQQEIIDDSNKKIKEALQQKYKELDKLKELDKAIDQLAKKAKGSVPSSSSQDEEDTVPYNTKITGLSTAKEDPLKGIKEWKEKELALNTIYYRTGKRNYEEYLQDIDRISLEYFDRILQLESLSDDERIKYQAQFYDEQAKIAENNAKRNLDQITAEALERKRLITDAYIKDRLNKERYDFLMEEQELDLQRNILDILQEGSKEWLAAYEKYQSMLIAQQNRLKKETEQKEKELNDIKKKYFGLNLSERQNAYQQEIDALLMVYDREIALAADSAEEIVRIEQAKQDAIQAIRDKYFPEESEDPGGLKGAVAKSVEWLNSDGGKAVTQSFGQITSGMGSIFSQLTSYIQAEVQLQTAAIEEKYDKEIKNAQGNARLVASLEKDKEEEIAKVKNEANKKMFAMQVIQAVAQTATAALNAYSSAAAIPVVGHIMAPIAAATAIAAGMMQVSAIKKQQEAANATGYAEGGYTRQGDKYEVAGVVHAGEWVASQKLLQSPVTAPIISMLDDAQRNNSMASLSLADSNFFASPANAAFLSGVNSQAVPNVVVNVPESYSPEVLNNLQSAIGRLVERLKEPFTTVNSMTGKYGIESAQDEYRRYKKNVYRK